MRIASPPYCTSHLFHRLHSPSRMIGAAARSRTMAHVLHNAARARIAPPPGRYGACPRITSPRCAPPSDVMDGIGARGGAERCPAPRAWPFDTPMPSGLPKLPIGSGHPLHPRAPGATEAFGAGADKNRLPPLPQLVGVPRASGAGGATDTKGMLVDVYA